MNSLKPRRYSFTDMFLNEERPSLFFGKSYFTPGMPLEAQEFSLDGESFDDTVFGSSKNIRFLQKNWEELDSPETKLFQKDIIDLVADSASTTDSSGDSSEEMDEYFPVKKRISKKFSSQRFSKMRKQKMKISQKLRFSAMNKSNMKMKLTLRDKIIARKGYKGE